MLFTYEITTHTPAPSDIEKVNLGLRSHKNLTRDPKKMQIPTSVDSCTPDPWPPLDSVPTFGEFVPRFGISTSFEENLGI